MRKLIRERLTLVQAVWAARVRISIKHANPPPPSLPYPFDGPNTNDAPIVNTHTSADTHSLVHEATWHFLENSAPSCMPATFSTSSSSRISATLPCICTILMALETIGLNTCRSSGRRVVGIRAALKVTNSCWGRLSDKNALKASQPRRQGVTFKTP